jgi:ribosomal protein L37E
MDTGKTSVSNQMAPSLPISICVQFQSYLNQRTDIDDVWITSDNGKSIQITFCMRCGRATDRIRRDLVDFRIGIRNDTKVFVLPTILLAHEWEPKNDESMLHMNSTLTNVRTQSNAMDLHENQDDCEQHVHGQLAVEQVKTSIRASTVLSFDFVLLVCVASMLTALGLIENSPLIIVVSLLMSPVMKPMRGIVFGLSIRDAMLCRRCLRNTLITLLICIACGFVLG